MVQNTKTRDTVNTGVVTLSAMVVDRTGLPIGLVGDIVPAYFDKMSKAIIAGGCVNVLGIAVFNKERLEDANGFATVLTDGYVVTLLSLEYGVERYQVDAIIRELKDIIKTLLLKGEDVVLYRLLRVYEYRDTAVTRISPSLSKHLGDRGLKTRVSPTLLFDVYTGRVEV